MGLRQTAAYSTLAVVANLYPADVIKILKQAGVDSNNITAVKTDCGAVMLKILPGDKNYRQFFVAY